MKRIPFITITVFLFLCSILGWQAAASASKAPQPVSGKVIDGYRVLPIRNTTETVNLTVYRGDYIKFEFDDSITDAVLSIPSLSVERILPGNPNDAPYFKMKNAGTYAFTLGAATGDINVVEYRQPSYREVTTEKAAALIDNVRPLILDVRTRGEFKGGHLKDAILIPVQELQRRYKEINAHKNQDILIYCATGNRSTVASKILIDNGFNRIYNLRYGIYDWGKKRYPVIR